MQWKDTGMYSEICEKSQKGLLVMPDLYRIERKAKKEKLSPAMIKKH